MSPVCSSVRNSVKYADMMTISGIRASHNQFIHIIHVFYYQGLWNIHGQGVCKYTHIFSHLINHILWIYMCILFVRELSNSKDNVSLSFNVCETKLNSFTEISTFWGCLCSVLNLFCDNTLHSRGK